MRKKKREEGEISFILFQEQAGGGPYTPLVEDPVLAEMTSNQQVQIADPSSVEDAWASLVEANNEYNLRGGAMTPAHGGIGAASAPTGDNPVFKPWPGHHEFHVSFQKLSENSKNKSWVHSTKLKKLFIGNYLAIRLLYLCISFQTLIMRL